MAGKRKDNKGRILKDGESQRKQDGRYLYRYTAASGERRTVYALTLGELREKEKQIERDLQDGIDGSKANMTLNELFSKYMDTKSLRESTRCNYLATWRNMVSKDLGSMKICAIKQLHIKGFYAGLVKVGYSKNTIKLLHNLIYPTLELAVDSDIIRKNPAKGCFQNVGGTVKERNALTQEQQQAMLDFAKRNPKYNIYHPLLVFALCTGCRIGELLGLTWRSCDLRKNVVHIRQQLIYKNLGDGCQFYITPLKTDAGLRDIPLTATARKALLQQRELCMMLGRTAKATAQETDLPRDFVFINSLGKPYTIAAINNMLYDLTDEYNVQEESIARKEHREPLLLPHISAHILRHTACTRLAESGLQPKTLQYIMGHSDIGITLNTYAHIDLAQLQKQVEDIQENIMIG